MKKVLVLLSITLMTLWAIGFFVLNLTAPVHLLLVLSLLLYIRSLLYISDSDAQIARRNKYTK